jgi:hypothetical protein
VLAKLIALIIHELAEPVVAEYRKLDGQPESRATDAPGTDADAAWLPTVTAADTEHAPQFDHDRRSPVTAAQVGFRAPGT